MQVAQAGKTGSTYHQPYNPWANQLGGFLYAQISHEAHRPAQRAVTQDPEHLFRKTKKLFLDAGLNELDHMRFREDKLKKLCLQELWKMTFELNPHHPRFKPQPDPDTENYDWSEPPLIEPQISRERLEAEITCWYIRENAQPKNHPCKKHNEDTTKSSSGHSSQPKETQSTPQSSTHPIKKANQNSQNKQHRKNWRSIESSDLLGPELETRQVCEAILDQLISNGYTNESLETIGAALRGAQYKASREHREKKTVLPIRLSRASHFLLHQFALTSLGKKGRGHSSKYRRIKNNTSKE